MNDPKPNNRSIPLSEHLRNAEAVFCLIPAKSKAPTMFGWQNKPQPLDVALRHAKAGGNVGLLTGRAGLAILDFDHGWADAVELLPDLAHTIQTFRADAPERRKFIVRIEGEMPPSRKTEAMEILARGRQGVIVGVHPAGARIEWTGDSIATIPAQEVIALWQTITGKPITGSDRPEAGPPDADAVKRSMELAERVLHQAGVAHRPWRQHETDGRKAILVTCPFNPPDNPHENDTAAAILIGADGSIGATCHHARCQERIAAHGKGGWSLLKDISGYDSHAQVNARRHTEALLDQLRTWVREADTAEHVPLALQAINGYRTLATDKTAAMAVLDLFGRWGKLEHVPLSLRSVRQLMNCGSPNTVKSALERLSAWFIVRDYGPFQQGHSPTYSIATPLRTVAEEMLTDFCVDRAHIQPKEGDAPSGTYARDLRNLSAPLATHRTHDAFCQSLTPLTEEELAQRNADRAAAEEPKPPLRMTRQLRRRLDAVLPSLGRNCLIVVDALKVLDGSSTRAALSAYTHLSECSISRCVGKLTDLGMVDADRKTVTLRPDWMLQLEQATPHMPTAGLGRARHISDLDAIIHNANRLLKREGLPEPETKRLMRRREKAYLAKKRFAGADGVDLSTFDAAPRVRVDDEQARAARLRYAASRQERQAAAKPADWMLRRIYEQEIDEHGEELHAWMTVTVTGGNSGWALGKTQEQIIDCYKAMRQAKATMQAPGVEVWA